MSANILLAKASHMAKSKVKEQETIFFQQKWYEKWYISCFEQESSHHGLKPHNYNFIYSYLFTLNYKAGAGTNGPFYKDTTDRKVKRFDRA